MSYLLDTNVCIQYLNGRSESIRKRFESASPEDIVHCSVVKAELIYGALKSANPQRNLTRLNVFFGRFPSLPFDDYAAEIYGQIRWQLQKGGKPIGPNDLMIAAIAVAHDATLVTHNIKEFSRVKGLRYADWESD